MKSFITSRGIEITFKPIPQMLIDRVRFSHIPPNPPTYEIKNGLGATEIHDHDETTLTTDADKAAWADYIAARDKATEDSNRAFMRLVFFRGIECKMPDDDTWAREQELMGIPVPADALDRKLHWLETEIIATVEDANAIVRGALEASGVPQEIIGQAEESFRHSPQRDEVAGLADSSGQVDDDPEIRGSDVRAQTGIDDEPVRRTRRKR